MLNSLAFKLSVSLVNYWHIGHLILYQLEIPILLSNPLTLWDIESNWSVHFVSSSFDPIFRNANLSSILPSLLCMMSCQMFHSSLNFPYALYSPASSLPVTCIHLKVCRLESQKSISENQIEAFFTLDKMLHCIQTPALCASLGRTYWRFIGSKLEPLFHRQLVSESSCKTSPKNWEL